MKIIAAPMAVCLPARGPATQTRELMSQALRRGHSFLTAAAHDAAWTDLPGICNLQVPCPRLMGWIPELAVRTLIKPLFLEGGRGAKRSKMKSFEEVQAVLGLAARRYFMRDYAAMCGHFTKERPDVVVAGRYSAVLAAKHAGIPVAVIIDKPQTAEFACSPELTRHLRKAIASRGWGKFTSILDIAWLADLVLVPNLRLFSDLGQHEAVYLGGLRSAKRESGRDWVDQCPKPQRNLILAYPGVSGIDVDHLCSVLATYLKRRNDATALRSNPPLEALVVHPGRTGSFGPVALAPRFENRGTLGRAVLMIHHGGQNSCQDCLREGIPQLIVHGGHFERAANATHVEQAGAGLVWLQEDGDEAFIERMDKLLDDPRYGSMAASLESTLATGGGWDQALDHLERLAGEGRSP